MSSGIPRTSSRDMKPWDATRDVSAQSFWRKKPKSKPRQAHLHNDAQVLHVVLLGLDHLVNHKPALPTNHIHLEPFAQFVVTDKLIRVMCVCMCVRACTFLCTCMCVCLTFALSEPCSAAPCPTRWSPDPSPGPDRGGQRSKKVQTVSNFFNAARFVFIPFFFPAYLGVVWVLDDLHGWR